MLDSTFILHVFAEVIYVGLPVWNVNYALSILFFFAVYSCVNRLTDLCFPCRYNHMVWKIYFHLCGSVVILILILIYLL